MPVAVRRDTLQFDANVPYTLTLKYATGREVSNGRIMFTTMEDECFFLDPDHALAIHSLGLAQNEPFVLLKRVVGAGKAARTTFEARRIAQAQQPVSRPAAAAANQQNPSTEPPQAQDISLSRTMACSYVAAIDALIVAKNYADSKSVTFRITEEEIRAAAACIFIEAGKIKARSGWQNGHANGGSSWQQ